MGFTLARLGDAQWLGRRDSRTCWHHRHRPHALITVGTISCPVPLCWGEGLDKGANSAGISGPEATLGLKPQLGEEFPPIGKMAKK